MTDNRIDLGEADIKGRGLEQSIVEYFSSFLG